VTVKGSLIDAESLETERRAEYDRRAAYDTRAELARREEYDKRLEYDRRNQIALCSTRDPPCVDWKEQVNLELTQMGKIIEIMTTMLTKPTQPENEAEKTTKTAPQHSHAKQIDETQGP